MKKFDIVVLGGGPGGYVAAIKGAQFGKSVCLIEEKKLGGICLNWGCIPTKALLKNAEILNYVKSSEKYGIYVDNITFDFDFNIQRSRDVANRLSKGIDFLLKKNNIFHKSGFGKFESKNIIKVNKQGKSENIYGDHIIISTGARPKTVPGIDLDGEKLLTSKEALELKKVPKNIVIIGSGAIGCEFAHYFNAFGSEVHLIELSDRILPAEDIEISKELEKKVLIGKELKPLPLLRLLKQKL